MITAMSGRTFSGWHNTPNSRPRRPKYIGVSIHPASLRAAGPGCDNRAVRGIVGHGAAQPGDDIVEIRERMLIDDVVAHHRLELRPGAAHDLGALGVPHLDAFVDQLRVGALIDRHLLAAAELELAQ